MFARAPIAYVQLDISYCRASERAVGDDVGGVVGGVDDGGLVEGVRLSGLPWLAWAVAAVAVAVFGRAWLVEGSRFGVPEVPWFVWLDGLAAAWSAACDAACGDDGRPSGA